MDNCRSTPGSTDGIGPDATTLKTSVDVDVVVIGAGQAGLSAAYFLNQAGLGPDSGYVVLDANSETGGAWQHRWPALKFGTAHRIHPLPGWPFGDVDASKPASDRRDVVTGAGTWHARAIINATGTWSNPFWPHYPGMERFKGASFTLSTTGARTSSPASMWSWSAAAIPRCSY